MPTPACVLGEQMSEHEHERTVSAAAPPEIDGAFRWFPTHTFLGGTAHDDDVLVKLADHAKHADERFAALGVVRPA